MRRLVAPGVYFHEEKGYYYYRPWVHGRRTERVLESRTLREALREYHRRVEGPQELTTVADLTRLYLEAGAPGRSGVARDFQFVSSEKLKAEAFLPFFGKFVANELRIATCLAYKDWRAKRVRNGFNGRRTVDMELTTLSNVLNYAVLKGEVEVNRILGRPRFRSGAEVAHCRDHCPRSGDELHRLASALEPVLAWQMLFEATSGCRTNEALPLRWDAGQGEPGHVRSGKYLCIARLKQGDDDPYDYIEMNPVLKLVVKSMREWRDTYFPGSPFFFQSPRGQQPIGDCSLNQALRRIVKEMLPGRRITSHGMRAFYVTWRRVSGIPVAQIAEEVGHRSGVALIYTTYGRKVPPWATRAFSPYPKTVKAFWSNLSKPENVVRLAG